VARVRGTRLIERTGVEKDGGADQAKKKGEAAVDCRGGADFRPSHSAAYFPSSEFDEVEGVFVASGLGSPAGAELTIAARRDKW
jgi:hypothetical protein